MADRTVWGYWDSITSARALEVDPEEALRGLKTLSAETDADQYSEEGIAPYIMGNFGSFMALVRNLTAEQSDLLLSYYLLGKTQTQLAVYYRSTQTAVSQRLRTIVKALCSFLLIDLSEEGMAKIFTACGKEHIGYAKHRHTAIVDIPTSKIFATYLQLKSFQGVADKFDLHRAGMRFSMRETCCMLREESSSEAQALGAYFWMMLEKAAPVGRGVTVRESAKSGNVYMSDPDIMGQFRVHVEDEHFDSLFAPRSDILYEPTGN